VLSRRKTCEVATFSRYTSHLSFWFGIRLQHGSARGYGDGVRGVRGA
jgi:hypothetical protein